MTGTSDGRTREVEDSTPESRKTWAFAWASRRAAANTSFTIREVQAATREHFGRGIGNQEATVLVGDVKRLAHGDKLATTSSRSDGDRLQSLDSRHMIKMITRLMDEAGITEIEILADGRIRLKTA